MIIEFGQLRSERLGFTLDTVLKALETNGIWLTEILVFENVKLPRSGYVSLEVLDRIVAQILTIQGDIVPGQFLTKLQYFEIGITDTTELLGHQKSVGRLLTPMIPSLRNLNVYMVPTWKKRGWHQSSAILQKNYTFRDCHRYGSTGDLYASLISQHFFVSTKRPWNLSDCTAWQWSPDRG